MPVPWSLFSTFAMSQRGIGDVHVVGDRAEWLHAELLPFERGLEYTSDTRIDLPFATQGTMKTVTADFSGGPQG